MNYQRGNTMQRRDFIRLSAAGVGIGMMTPALAETSKQVTETRDIYYTEAAPGRWSGKVATHLPTITVEKTDSHNTVKIVTAHEMKGYEHYIVKHTLLDKNYKFIAEHLFNPTEDKVAESSFILDNYSGTVYALSLCNKHDLWLNSAAV
jgi:superoxide reductase